MRRIIVILACVFAYKTNAQTQKPQSKFDVMFSFITGNTPQISKTDSCNEYGFNVMGNMLVARAYLHESNRDRVSAIMKDSSIVSIWRDGTTTLKIKPNEDVIVITDSTLKKKAESAVMHAYTGNIRN